MRLRGIQDVHAQTTTHRGHKMDWMQAAERKIAAARRCGVPAAGTPQTYCADCGQQTEQYSVSEPRIVHVSTGWTRCDIARTI